MDKIALTAHNAKRTDRYIQYQANPIGMYVIKPTLQYIRSGHFSDRTFFANPVIEPLLNLLSVINIDSLFVCLPVTLLSFILFLCSRELPLRRAAKYPKWNKTDNYRAVAVLKDIDAVVSCKKHRSAYKLTNQCFLPLPVFTAKIHTENLVLHILPLPVWNAWNIPRSYR